MKEEKNSQSFILQTHKNSRNFKRNKALIYQQVTKFAYINISSTYSLGDNDIAKMDMLTWANYSCKTPQELKVDPAVGVSM